MSQYISFFSKFSFNAISTFFPVIKHEVFVGRWSIPNKNTNIVINRIFDRNNEDHCGVCISNNNYKNEKNIIDNEEYYRAFIM
jgi:hypothetical protein